MLQIRDLTISHKKDLRCLLEGFSFVLGPGDRAVVIGEEGNGKSTLLRLLYDPALAEGYVEWSGEISRKGRAGYLAQELGPAELALPARAFLAAEPAFGALTPRERAALARELGLPPEAFDAARPLSSFSGGERVKLQLARALAARPDWLLLDEPSNDLDLDALAWLEEYLAGCRLPMLLISHDETLIERVANVVIHLELLRRKQTPRATVARLPYAAYMETRRRAFAQQERVARKERELFDEKLARYRRIRQRVEHEQRAISRGDPAGGRLLKKKMHTVQAMGRRFEAERERLTALPELEEPVFLRFPEAATVPRGKLVLELALPRLEAGGRLLAENVALRLAGPEKIGVIGPNGAGKTTLLRHAAALLLPRRDLRAAYMPQDYGEALDLAQTPPALLCRSGSREEETRARSYLGSLRYTTDEMDHPAGQLSGGQKAKLLLAKLALEGANVLILDEPTRNLSPLSNPVVRGVLRDFPGAILSVSHDRKYLAEVCTAVYALGPDGLTRV